MVKCFMDWWSKVWWHLTCYWRGILVFVVLALFLDGTVSAPFSPLLCPQLHSTGSLDSADLYSAQPGASIFPHIPHPPACCWKDKPLPSLPAWSHCLLITGNSMFIWACHHLDSKAELTKKNSSEGGKNKINPSPTNNKSISFWWNELPNPRCYYQDR